MDPAGAHVSREFLDELGAQATRSQISAGEAHWQNGVCERACLELEDRFKTVLKANPPATEDDWLFCLYETVRGRNVHVHDHGFSASQHLLGRNPRLPLDLFSKDIDVAALSAAMVSFRSDGSCSRKDDLSSFWSFEPATPSALRRPQEFLREVSHRRTLFSETSRRRRIFFLVM